MPRPGPGLVTVTVSDCSNSESDSDLCSKLRLITPDSSCVSSESWLRGGPPRRVVTRRRAAAGTLSPNGTARAGPPATAGPGDCGLYHVLDSALANAAAGTGPRIHWPGSDWQVNNSAAARRAAGPAAPPAPGRGGTTRRRRRDSGRTAADSHSTRPPGPGSVRLSASVTDSVTVRGPWSLTPGPGRVSGSA